MNRLGLGHDGCAPSLLLHAIEMVHRSHTFSQWLALGDGSRNVCFRQQHGFWQAPIEPQLRVGGLGLVQDQKAARAKARRFTWNSP